MSNTAPTIHRLKGPPKTETGSRDELPSYGVSWRIF